MVGWLFRTIFGPVGRALVVAVLVAVAWIYWSIWPERPLAQRRTPGVITTSPYLVADGQVVVIENQRGGQIVDGKQTNGWWRLRLVRLADGRDLLGNEPFTYTVPFNRGRLQAIIYPDGRIDAVNTSNGKRTCTIPPDAQQPHRFILCAPSFSLMAVGDHTRPMGHAIWDAERGVKIRDATDVWWENATADGEQFSQMTDTEWTLVETRTGRIIARSSDELVLRSHSMVLHPEGKSLAIFSKGKPGRPSHITVFSLPDFKILNDIQDDRPALHFPKSLTYTRTGRLLRARGQPLSGLWDLSRTGAERIELADEGDHPYLFVAPDDQSFVSMDDQQKPTWTICRLGQVQPLAKIEGSLRCLFSRDGQSVCTARMIRKRPTGFVHDIVARLRRFFDINLPDIETIVVETKSGRIAHSIPGGYPVGFEADSLALWTHENVTNVVTNQSEIQFTKWSTRLPGPPWWLWLLSALALCTVAFDFRRSRRQ